MPQAPGPTWVPSTPVASVQNNPGAGTSPTSAARTARPAPARRRAPAEPHRPGPGSQPLFQQRERAGLEVFPPSHPLDRHHVPIAVKGENRLDVQHSCEPRLSAGDSPGPKQIIVPVHGQEHAGLGSEPGQLGDDLLTRPPQLGQLGSPECEQADAQ